MVSSAVLWSVPAALRLFHQDVTLCDTFYCDLSELVKASCAVGTCRPRLEPSHWGRSSEIYPKKCGYDLCMSSRPREMFSTSMCAYSCRITSRASASTSLHAHAVFANMRAYICSHERGRWQCCQGHVCLHSLIFRSKTPSRTQFHTLVQC